jgi:hypothetical protein
MSTLINFDYTYQGAEGHCQGVSFKQALDHAKLDFLKNRGFTLKHPKFLLEKSKLKDAPFSLRLSPLSARRYQELYLAFREGQLSEAGKALLADYSNIIKAKEEFNERHRIGVPVRTRTTVASAAE